MAILVKLVFALQHQKYTIQFHFYLVPGCHCIKLQI